MKYILKKKKKNTLNSVWIQYQAQMDSNYSQLNGNLWEPEQRRRPNLISSNSIDAIQFRIDFPIVKRAFKTSPEHVTCYNPRAIALVVLVVIQGVRARNSSIHE